MPLLLTLEQGAIAIATSDALRRSPTLGKTATQPLGPLGSEGAPSAKVERPGAIQPTTSDGNEGARPGPRTTRKRGHPTP